VGQSTRMQEARPDVPAYWRARTNMQMSTSPWKVVPQRAIACQTGYVKVRWLGGRQVVDSHVADSPRGPDPAGTIEDI